MAKLYQRARAERGARSRAGPDRQHRSRSACRARAQARLPSRRRARRSRQLRRLGFNRFFGSTGRSRERAAFLLLCEARGDSVLAPSISGGLEKKRAR